MGAPEAPEGDGRVIPTNDAPVKIGAIFIKEMVFRQAGRLIKRAKAIASSGYSAAHELAPGIQKGADLARRGYAYARDNGLIEKYGGRHAEQIHGAAQKGMDGYERLERAARDADGMIGRMR